MYASLKSLEYRLWCGSGFLLPLAAIIAPPTNSPQGKRINFYWPHINESKLIKFLFPILPLLLAYAFASKKNNKLRAKTYKIRGNRKIWLNSAGFYDEFENHQNVQHKAQQFNCVGIYLVMVKTMQELSLLDFFILYNIAYR